jgi:hypothetical protein
MAMGPPASGSADAGALDAAGADEAASDDDDVDDELPHAERVIAAPTATTASPRRVNLVLSMRFLSMSDVCVKYTIWD